MLIIGHILITQTKTHILTHSQSNKFIYHNNNHSEVLRHFLKAQTWLTKCQKSYSIFLAHSGFFDKGFPGSNRGIVYTPFHRRS